VASNFPVSKQKEWRQIDKKEGKVRIAHISRISPKKNLAFLIDCLQYVTAETELLIAGPIDDQKYWDLCQKKAENLPNNILFRYIGEVNYPEVATILQKSHLFCLLTFGENFGHAIFEAFINGRPVLISDKTPWRQLTDRKAGWDLSLDNRAGISNQLEAIASMTQEAYDPWSKGAWTYAQQFLQQTDLLEQYAALFP
jgi:glycosyltransferase involved in cell wall biosynthesis